MELSDESRAMIRETWWYKEAEAFAAPFLAEHDTVTWDNLKEYGESLGAGVSEHGDTLVFTWPEHQIRRVTFTDTGYIIHLNEKYQTPEIPFDNLNVIHFLSGMGSRNK